MLAVGGEGSFVDESDFMTPTPVAQPVLLSPREVKLYRSLLFAEKPGSATQSRLQSLVAHCLLLLQGSLFVRLTFRGCVGLTVHEMPSSQFFTLVLDMEHGEPLVTEALSAGRYALPPRTPVLLAVYPSVDCSGCSVAEVRGRRFWISWNENLPPLDAHIARELRLDYTTGERASQRARTNQDPIPRAWTPFCCKDVVKMHHRRLRKDTIFQALLSRSGSFPNMIYEIKTMQTKGGLYDRRFFRLVDDRVEAVENGYEYSTKIHAFKNYFCYRHDYWFSVDLFTNGSEGACAEDVNRTHKMRMSPFTRIENTAVIDRFFAAMGFGPDEEASVAATTASDCTEEDEPSPLE